MKKSILLFSILIWVAFVSTANDRRGIIIDSDCGADDLRAISLIFASDQYDILAITTSDGVLSPEAGLKKVRSLLCTLNHQGIATAAGRTTVSDPCECRKLNENILWGKECDDYYDYSLNAAQLIQKILSDHRDVLFFAFGSLTNLHDALELYPKGAECITGILWYNRSITKAEGFNFISDSFSAKVILGYHLPITAVSSNPQNPVIFNETMLDTYRHYKTQYSANVYAALSTVAMKEVILNGHFQIWDELLPVYLANPQLFDTLQTLGKIRSVRLKSSVSQDIIVTSIKEFFRPQMHENIVFSRFPVEKDFYAEDFQNGIDTMISLYGIQEFRAGILTNELHGHLGVYAIIGVKMGIRALEYFNCEIDELKIMSYAGNEPPVSCLNDGLQVSTGATLGHGLISVPETLSGRMAATFYYKNQGITISVRKETESMIKQDFSSIIKEFGLLTEEYWLQVRKLAIQYWLELDRNIIFEIHYFEN